MKIAEYNEMMAYLTRPEPEVLPQPKPQELLDIQEENKIERQQDTMDKASPFLMDESVDFIERENFAEGTPEELEELRKVLDELKGKYPGLQLSIPIDKRKENFIPRIRINTEAQYKNLLEGKKKSFSIDEVDKLKKLLPKYAKVFAPKIEKSLKEKEKMFQEKRREFGVRGKYGDREKVVSELNQIVNEISEGKRPIFDLKRLRNGELIDTKLSPRHFLTVDDRTGKPKYLSKNNFNFLKKISNKDLSVIARAREAKASPKMLQQIKNLTVKNYDEFVNQFPSRTIGVPSNIGQKIMDSLFRHAQTGGEKFQFISGDSIENYKIKDLSKGDTLTADRVNKLIQEKDPRFKEFKKVQDQVNKLKKTKYINPVSKKETTLFRALQESTGDIFPIHIDHIKGVREEPLKFFQPLLSKTNLGKSAANTVEELKKIGARKVLPGKKYAQGAVIDFEKQVEDLKKFADRKILQTEASGFVRPKTPKEIIAAKKLTALQEIMQGGKNVGVDPSLLMKAGFEEFVKPTGKFAGQVARGVGTAADLAISAGKGGTGLALGALLEADPIITGMSEGKTFGQTARDTFVGSAIDLIPGVNLGSLNEDLIKLADTEEQKVAVQNLIDYQQDYDRFNKDFRAFKSYNQLNQVELEELGFTASDLVDIENKLAKRFEDIQTRAPKVYNPEVFSLARELATKEAEKRKTNLETGIAGKIFGDRMAKDPNFIKNQIQQIMAASTGAEGATDSYVDNYSFLPQEQLTSDELDERFDMEGGIMAANGGRIGYSSGSDGTALAIEESLEAFQRYLKAGGKLGYKDFIALGNEGVSKFFNTGGRVGFADGPIDPKRRTFMKIMAGIASLPIFSKFIGKSEVAKPIVKIAGSSTKMPDWFPDLINKAMFSGTGKKIDADIMKYEVKELPGIEIYRHDDGKVFVSGKNEYGKSYEIEYEPPGYELVDETTGKAVKKPGDFIAQEEIPVNVDPDGNADFDVEVLEDLDQLLGSDTRIMEEFATGKKIKEMKSGEYNVGQAEVRAEQAADEAAELEVFDEID